MIYTLLVTVFVLGVLIFVHELGHFLAAKAVNVQVLRFSIGLGKPLLSFRWGETEYALSAIPFGGYVKMVGDDPVESLEGGAAQEPEIEEDDGVEIDPARRFGSKGLAARFLVISAGPLMNMVTAALLYMGILYFQGAETYATTIIAKVSDRVSLPGIEQIEPYSRVVAVNGVGVDNWNGVVEAVLDSKSEEIRFALEEESGRSYTAVVGAPGDSLRTLLAGSLQPLIDPEVGGIVPGKPAAVAGIERGDRIISIDGEEIRSWQQMTGIIHNNPGKQLNMVVRRGGETRTVDLTPEISMIPGPDTELMSVGLIGIRPPSPGMRVKVPLGEAVVSGFNTTVYTTSYIVKSLSGLFTGLVTRSIPVSQARDFLGGPVMIGQMAGESARSGDLWAFMAILSINLALLNLLPIPVLDGGHLLFMAIEVVRFGKPLSARQRMRLIQVGLVIVLALMIFATANDIGRVFGL